MGADVWQPATEDMGERRAALRAECLDKFRDQHAAILNASGQSCTWPAGRYSVDYSARNTNLLPHLSRIRGGEAGALGHPARGCRIIAPANAVDNVVLQLRLADTLAEEPTLISRWCRSPWRALCAAIARSGIAGGRADRNGRASACKPKSTSG